MKKILFLLISLFYLNSYSQEKQIITDSCFISKHKFVLTEKNGIAGIKAFLGKQEISISNKVKMTPPVYFVKQNGKENVLQDDLFVKNGDIVKVFLIVGNKAPECALEGMNLKNDFCGMNVQGIIISPDGIKLTDFMYNGLTCITQNPLDMKDLYTFAHSK